MTFEDKFPELKSKVILGQLLEDGSLETPDVIIKEVVEEHCFSKFWIIKQIKEKLPIPIGISNEYEQGYYDALNELLERLKK